MKVCGSLQRRFEYVVGTVVSVVGACIEEIRSGSMA